MRSFYRSSCTVVFSSVVAVALAVATPHRVALADDKPADAPQVGVEALATAIEAHVKANSKDGAFVIADPVQKKDLACKLTLVHKERLAQIGKTLYFACCDFTEKDGTVYDVDFWMTWTPKGFTYSRMKVHKVGGKPRYGWKEKDGHWFVVPNEGEAASVDLLAESIEGYVRDGADDKGKFKIVDDVKKKDLMCELALVHTEKLAQIDEKLYFACCDFKATDGNTYDVDFWMTYTPDGFQYGRMKVHKDNGKPRYNWEEKGGRWTMVPIK